MVRILHYRNKCLGCNACVEANKSRWRVSTKDGKSTLIGGAEKNGIYVARVDEDEWKSNEKAMRNCPVRIIIVEKAK